MKTLRVPGVVLWLGLLLGAVSPLAAQDEVPPKVSEWNGYRRLDFAVSERACLLIVPKAPAPGNPWIWRTEFFGHEPQADLALLARGWHVAYMDLKDMFGAPRAIALMGRYYAHVVSRYDLAPRVVLEGFSRGGLFAFNFAASHPNRVAALYLDAPAIDLRSWPLRHGSDKEKSGCLAAYGLTEEAIGPSKLNPVNRIEPVAKAGIPIIAVCGGADQTVPLAENTAVLEKRYRELGAPIEVIVKPGGDHHPHSLPDPAPIVEFLTKNTRF
jgi:pimeloyl-ACP methyl ester carboxylesterase